MRLYVRISLIFLLLAATMGVVLRMMQSGIPIMNYKHLLHTHSHVALIGWIFNGTLIIVSNLLRIEKSQAFKRLFLGTQISIVGMLLSFPFQGYGAVSIAFSTLYIFCSYYLVFLIFKHTHDRVHILHRRFLRWGGIYLIFSSLGPFALGYFMSHDMGDSIWYKLSIYWFLHFLYNGFFVFVVFAHLVHEQTPKGKTIFFLMNASVVPLFGLSTLWTHPPAFLYILSGVGALLQFIAFAMLLFKSLISRIKRSIPDVLLGISLLAYGLKLVFQLAGSTHQVQEFINNTVPYTVIGFIHLVMLGFFSLFLLSYFFNLKLIPLIRLSKMGSWLFVWGIIFSEGLLFCMAGFTYWSLQWPTDFFPLLTTVSLLMPAGILLLAISVFTNRTGSERME